MISKKVSDRLLLCLLSALFVLIFECLTFLTSLFALANGSRRIGVARVRKKRHVGKMQLSFYFRIRKIYL